MTIEELLKQAQEAPEDYFGPLCDLEENNQARTGLVISRDSENEEVEEWNDILAILIAEYGEDDVTTFRSTHWAVGWTEEIIVTALDPYGNVHPAFKEAIINNKRAMEVLT